MPGSHIVRSLGIMLTLLCVGFFVNSLLGLDVKDLVALPIDGVLWSIVVWSVFYAVLLAGLTQGFVQLVQASGYRAATPSEALVVWGQSNIAKYLPGNVLHFAGRQLIGARFGWPQGHIAAASLLEIGLQLLVPCGLAVALLLVSGKLGMLGRYEDWLVPVVLMATVVFVLVALGWRSRARLPQRLLQPLARMTPQNPGALLPALAWYLLFFVGMSVIVWALYALVNGHLALRHLPILAAAFLFSWVMGFVVPGAPGGIGVREGSFTALGGVFLSPDVLVIVALLMRLITLIGEGLIFLLALHVTRDSGTTDAARSRPGFAGRAAVSVKTETSGRSVAGEEINSVVSHR